MHHVHVAAVSLALVSKLCGHRLKGKGGTHRSERPMSRHLFNHTSHPNRIAAEDALRILTEAWAYYTPLPILVTEQSSQPSPVFEEYYAA